MQTYPPECGLSNRGDVVSESSPVTVAGLKGLSKSERLGGRAVEGEETTSGAVTATVGTGSERGCFGSAAKRTEFPEMQRKRNSAEAVIFVTILILELTCEMCNFNTLTVID